MRLINGGVGIGSGARIGIGDGDTTESPAPDHIGALLGRDREIVEQRVELIGVAVPPAIDRDRHDIGFRVEARVAKHALKLIADFRFECLERRVEQFLPPDTVLILLRQPGRQRRAYHEDQYRFARRTNGFVRTDVDRTIQSDGRKITSWRRDGADAELLEAFPVAYRYTGIDERNLNQRMQRFFLR